MLAATRSQVIHDQIMATIFIRAEDRMEGRFEDIKDGLNRMTLEMERFKRENEALKHKSIENVAPRHAERNKTKLQNTTRENLDNEEKGKMHWDPNNLMDKYKKMARKIRICPSIDTLLNIIDLPYSNKKMMVPFLPKSKVPQMELYDGSTDPIKHLETFNAHMTLHDFRERSSIKLSF